MCLDASLLFSVRVHALVMCITKTLHITYRITGIVRGRKVSRIAFFAVVREKTFAIQAILYIKIPTEIKNARKHSRMLPDSRNSRNFSSADDSRYTVSQLISQYDITYVTNMQIIIKEQVNML